MWCAGFTVGVELFFEEFIDRFVDVERRRVGSSNLEPRIQPKAARTLHKQLDLAARHLERRGLARFVRLAPLPPIIHVDLL